MFVWGYIPVRLAMGSAGIEIAALDPTRLSAINVGMLIWPFLNGKTPPGHRDKSEKLGCAPRDLWSELE